ncbi:hypothetical protein IscW_ISCW016459 [Ixodes scapularis]|uniref:Uncharacterized protein n=1 Tax=Ixodes scapularis TaxID=6945 RepID=B7P3F6_IXOSC|nr:hypothetical protein IscW_ISCW016459 [Ixodes scapularis]|eukprot:XP_002404105.1 hypothetical protein IscW_ISCW016459 [Ixodes scapularis]
MHQDVRFNGRDRKLEDKSDHLMDGIEAEETVRGFPPTNLLAIKRSVATTTEVEGNQDLATEARNSEATT